MVRRDSLCIYRSHDVGSRQRDIKGGFGRRVANAEVGTTLIGDDQLKRF